MQHAKLWMFHRRARRGEHARNAGAGGLLRQPHARWSARADPSWMEVRASTRYPRVRLPGGRLGASFPRFSSSSAKHRARAVRLRSMAGWLFCAGVRCPADVDFVASVPRCALSRDAREATLCLGGRRAPDKLVRPYLTQDRGDGADNRPLDRQFDQGLGERRWGGARSHISGLAASRSSLGRAVAARSIERSRAYRSGIRWLEVPRPYDDDWGSPLCEQHQQTDTRWSHAKLYELHDGARRRLLITSANLSRAAWGDPQRDEGLIIDNFELGVLVHVLGSFSDHLWKCQYQRATCEIDYVQPLEPPIAWLAAEWDGNELSVECRPISGVALASHVEVTVARAASGERISVAWSSANSVARMDVPWPARMGVPILMSVETADGDSRATAVHDVRTIDDGRILCGEFDETLLRETLDRLLEEKYGYLPVPGSDGTSANIKTGMGSVAAGADYAVPAYVDARRRFQLVDNWWKELCDADERSRPFILKDGNRICERWSVAAKAAVDRGLRLAARVAAEELALRIRRFT